MPTEKTYGGKDYDHFYGRTRGDMKAEAKWKEGKDKKEHRERQKKIKDKEI